MTATPADEEEWCPCTHFCFRRGVQPPLEGDTSEGCGVVFIDNTGSEQAPIRSYGDTGDMAATLASVGSRGLSQLSSGPDPYARVRMRTERLWARAGSPALIRMGVGRTRGDEGSTRRYSRTRSVRCLRTCRPSIRRRIRAPSAAKSRDADGPAAAGVESESVSLEARVLDPWRMRRLLRAAGPVHRRRSDRSLLRHCAVEESGR